MICATSPLQQLFGFVTLGSLSGFALCRAFAHIIAHIFPSGHEKQSISLSTEALILAHDKIERNLKFL